LVIYTRTKTGDNTLIIELQRDRMKLSSHATRHGPWLICSLVIISALVLIERCGNLWGKSILNVTIPVGQTGFPRNRRLTPLVSSPLFTPLIRGLFSEAVREGTNPVCETLRWLPPTSLTPEGKELECNNEEHCSFVFRNACIQRNQSFQVGGGGYKWLVEVAEGCAIPNPPTRECLLESGPSGNPIKVLYAEGGQKVEPGEGGFDPVPTVMLDRSGGQPGNFWHDTSVSFYPLFQNMRLRGLDDYEGYRIAVIDEYRMPSPESKGLDELYFVHNPAEFTDWCDFGDRKCFRELTLMRTSFKWTCRTHVVSHNPELNRYSDLVAKHFGVTGERPPLPETPSLFFLYRGGSRKLLNWDELAGSLDIPYVVHNMSASWREQIEAVRNASIIFGLHGAGKLALVLYQLLSSGFQLRPALQWIHLAASAECCQATYTRHLEKRAFFIRSRSWRSHATVLFKGRSSRTLSYSSLDYSSFFCTSEEALRSASDLGSHGAGGQVLPRAFSADQNIVPFRNRNC
jgi:hypothetical protein